MPYQNPFDNQDLVKFPCVGCGHNSVTDYIFSETLNTDEFRQEDYVNEVDFRTYLRMNSIEDDEDIRVYECNECGYHISYFPTSGCRYIP